jgi:peptidyl-prolyl isomerase D
MTCGVAPAGEKGIAPPGHEGEGKPYWFKGASFYRIINNFIDQVGAGTDSIYGGHFKDDPGGLALKHNRGGLLSMANIGPDTNDSHFSILIAPAPHLDGSYTIFGELVSGWDVAMRINNLASGQPENTAPQDAGAVIVDSGQIR